MEGWRNEPEQELQEAYRRVLADLQGLAEGNRSVLRRLRADLEIVLRNEEATRRLLSQQVYGVPEDWLDEVMRLRLEELDE